MKRRAALSAFTLSVLACEVRDVTVFELAHAGTAGTPAAAGAAGTAGVSQGGASGAAGVSPVAGTDPGAVGGGGASAGTGGEAGMSCGSNADCPQGWFCEKASCADATGSCDLRPTKPTLDYAPVCGCDGVTYWNDVTRRQAGATLLEAAQCSTTARVCNGGGDCVVPFASCARLVSRGEQCSPSSQGACWLLPPQCPDPKSDPDVWQECRPPMPGVPPPACFDTCSAIRSERPHQHPYDLKLCP